jgi:aspartyl-tRNA(Asn)/glutamyl-tRNA(Gln) amidotransferase subunit A
MSDEEFIRKEAEKVLKDLSDALGEVDLAETYYVVDDINVTRGDGKPGVEGGFREQIEANAPKMDEEGNFIMEVGKCITAEDKVAAFLEEIEKGDTDIKSFIQVNPSALEDAKNAKDGRLAEKIIAIKSNINVKGLRATCASRTLEDYVSPYDATVIQRIKAEGGVIIGMTNMDEFACGSSGETSAFAATQNPAAPGRIPGGSSSGSATAVAADFCDMALGSDTGGSIRNPASHCGVVGFKPTYGRVPRYGLIDLAMSLDQIGPFARDVE